MRIFTDNDLWVKDKQKYEKLKRIDNDFLYQKVI